MKQKLILGSFLALAFSANSQNIFPSSGNAGIGTTSPTNLLDITTASYDKGITITQTGSGASGLRLHNTTSGGHNYGLFSYGAGSPQVGDCGIYDFTNVTFPFHIDGATNNIGLGTSTPAMKLDMPGNSAIADDGIRFTQAGVGGCNLNLNNAYTGGHNWQMSSRNTFGDFYIRDNTAGVDRITISSTGRVGIGQFTGSAKLYASTTTESGAIQGDVNSPNSCTGTSGNAICSVNTGATYATGIRGSAQGAKNNMGGYFIGKPDCVGAAQTYGVYATIRGASPSFTPCSGDLAGFFDGDAYVNGSSFSTTGYISSDRKLKKDIKALTNGLDKIRLLKPSTYHFRTDEFGSMDLPKENQLGLIAQDLEEVYPELVKEVAELKQFDIEGKVTGTIPAHKVVNYVGLIPVLISGIQEQQKTIAQQSQINADLQKQLDEQKELINSMKTSGTTGINAAGTIETGFQMSQNEPNPFTHETIVKYTLPQSVNTAFMAVYDLTGKQITTFPIQQKGASSLTITSEKLSAGIYIYSIVADGKVVDSKRMIVADK